MWQAVTAIVGLTATLVAAFTAYLLYRGRPLAVRAIEMHSTQLKQEALGQLISVLPNRPDLFKYEADAKPFRDDSVDKIESSELCLDLLRHIPPDNRLMHFRRQYEEEWTKVGEGRAALARQLRDRIDGDAREAGLLGVGNVNDGGYIGEKQCVAELYFALVTHAGGSAVPYERLKEASKQLTFSIAREGGVNVDTPTGVVWFRASSEADAQRAKNFLIAIVERLPTLQALNQETSLHEAAGTVSEDSVKLETTLARLRYEADRLKALPLLPNFNCPILRTSLPGLVPGWLQRFKR